MIRSTVINVDCKLECLYTEINSTFYYYKSGPGSSSGTALGYGLDGPGSIPGVGGGGDFSSLLHVKTVPEVHSASYKMNTGGFPRG